MKHEVKTEGGETFTILDSKNDKKCKHEFHEEEIDGGMTCINPDGEIVVGYYRDPVWVTLGSYKQTYCSKCGYIEKGK